MEAKEIVMGYLILVFLWAAFYISHSLLANLNIKRKIKGLMGRFYRWYRFVYSVYSTVFLFVIFVFGSTIPKILLLANTQVTTYIGYMLASFGTIIIIKAFKHFDKKRFLGLQFHDDLKSLDTFISSGLHAYVRHPLYSGTLLIFIGFFFFEPTSTSLIHLVMLFLYLPFGIYFEEKQLISVFGKQYLDYKQSVPSLIPFLKIKGK